MYNNAKVFYITAKKEATVTTLLSKNLPERFQDRSPIILESGGVWYERKRVLTDRKIPKQGTLKVYVTEMQGKKYSISPEQIHFETNDFLIMIKPSGINTVSDRSHLFWNLTYGVKEYLSSQNLSRQKNNYDPQPMTRLDLMVSGLILYPKHKDAEKTFFQLTQDRKIKKLYHAYLEQKEGLPECKRIQDKLSFINKAKRDPQGKNAHSLFIKRQENNENNENKEGGVCYSVIIFTGRRHQIRCHASQYLSPIIGDGFYGSRVKVKGQGVQLYAVGLNFFYKGKRYRFRYFLK